MCGTRVRRGSQASSCVVPGKSNLQFVQEVTEPAVVAVDRQAVFPDTWSLAEERGWQERARLEPGAPESGCHTPVEDEQLGGEMPPAGGLVRPARGPETPRRPEGTTEVTTEARMDRPELPRAVAVDTPTSLGGTASGSLMPNSGMVCSETRETPVSSSLASNALGSHLFHKARSLLRGRAAAGRTLSTPL